MHTEKIKGVYFSPTGTTKTLTCRITQYLSMLTGKSAAYYDFTLPCSRTTPLRFEQNDLVVFGMPVYAGRLPNVLLKYLDTISGGGALAIPIVLFGNRNYDDALKELKIILESHGFTPIAAAAFVGEHSFSRVLGKGRPDNDDFSIADSFSGKIADKLNSGTITSTKLPDNDVPLHGYYQPRDRAGNTIDIRKVTPKTNGNCTNCGLCAEICPMGSIDHQKTGEFINICIKCGACIKKCPVNAKYYDDKNYLYHKAELEDQYKRRAEPICFL